MAEKFLHQVTHWSKKIFAFIAHLKPVQFWNYSGIIVLLVLSLDICEAEANEQDKQWPDLETISETNISRLSLLNSFQITDCFVSNLSLSADGTILASSGSQVIQLWDVVKGQPLRTVSTTQCPDSLSLGVAFSPTAPLISYFDEENVVIEDVSTHTVQFTLPDTSNPIAFNNSGTLLATVDDTLDCEYESTLNHDPTNCQYVSVWDVATGIKQMQLRGYASVEEHIGAFSSDSRYLFFPHHSTILAWDPITGELGGEFAGQISDDGYFATYDMTTSDEWTYVGGAQGLIIFRMDGTEITTLDSPLSFSEQEDFPYDYPFSLEGIGNLLVIGDGHGKISFIQPLTGEIVHSVQAYSQEEFVYALEVSQDRKLLVSAARTGQIQVWGVPSE